MRGLQRLAGLRPAGTRCYTVRAADPLHLPSSTSLLDYVWRGLEVGSGGGTAIHCPRSGRHISYEKLRAASGSLAAWLSDNCSSSLGVLLPNSPEAVVSALGAFEAGVPLAPFNPYSTVDELARGLRLSRTSCVVTKSSLVHTVLEAVRQVETETADTYPIQIISTDDDMTFNGKSVLQFVDLTSLRPLPGPVGRPCFLSQTWENGKGLTALEVNSGSLLASCVQAASPHLAVGQRVLSDLPMFTRYGLSQSVLATLAAGSELVILPRRENMDSWVHKYQPSVACLLPSSLQTLSSPHDCLRSITVSGQLYPPTLNRLPLRMAERLTQHYGPPEGPAVFSQPGQTDPSRLGQPLAGTEAKVMVEGGEVGVMSEGQIWVKGPQLSPPDVWVSTGDSGYYDPEGTFYLTRARGYCMDGLGVWPGELETVLQAHKDVAIAAVFPAGPTLAAAVIPADPYHPPSPQELKLWLASKASPHKAVADILITSSIPTTDSGEINRPLLASRYIQPQEYAAVTSV